MQRSSTARLQLLSLRSVALLLITFVLPVLGADLFQAPPAQQTGCGTVDSPFGEARCVRLSYAGEVSSGQTFERKFSEKLLFRLNPKTAQSGWTIEVIPEAQDGTGQREYIWVVTPPYRFYNVRDLDTSYGTSAREAVEYSPRDFNFVLNEEQFKRAANLVELAVMSHPPSEKKTLEEFDRESQDAGHALRRWSVAKGG
ncbi:MAG TPA: hypothetical protein VN943_19960 [Candidatus Acidoferrum sp.]|nr:hypothetical protein [Candidatus Acidoferrum sp.]